MSKQKNQIIKPTFRNIFSIYFKTSKKRILITILTAALIFLALTSFFMIWYNYRYNSFFSYIDKNHNWNSDKDISIYGETYYHGPVNLEDDYLNKGIAEVTTKLEELVPNIQGKTTSSLRINLYANNSEDDYTEYILDTFDANATSIIESNLLQGRMPENYTELLYYRTNTTSELGINDIILFSGEDLWVNVNRTFTNYTIVGIVENLDWYFYQDGYSEDILRATFYDDYWSGITREQFITYNDLFYNNLNNTDIYSGLLICCVDIDYQININHLINQRAHFAALRTFSNSYHSFDYIPGHYTYFCHDLIGAFSNFERQWLIQTISVFASILPLIFLFGVLLFETFKIGAHEQESKYRLIKTHGLKNNLLAKLVFNDNLITISLSYILGFSAGLLVGYFIFLGLKIPKEVAYISALGQPIIPISLSLFFIFFTLTKFIYDLIQTKKASITTSEQYKKKRKGKVFRKIFSMPEVIALIPGGILTTVGIILFRIFYYAYDAPPSYATYAILSLLATSFGILLVMTTGFLILTRLVALIWHWIGNLSWKKTKSYFTLSLKHLAIFGKSYQRTILVIFILGVAIIPGLVMTKSANHQFILEADLSVGCADMIIEDWDVENNEWKNNISNIEGVELVTDLSTIKTLARGYDNDIYNFEIIKIHVIHNITEYLTIVDFTNLIPDGYTKEDIEQLEGNLTYLMSRDFAHKNRYDKDVIFRTTYFTEHHYEPLNYTYINDFSYYPLLSRQLSIQYDYSTIIGNIGFNLVMNEYSAEMIINRTTKGYTRDNHLIIKTTNDANKTRIKEEISLLFDLSVVTYEDKLDQIQYEFNSFANSFLIVNAIIATLAIFLFGLINAINVYKQRLRIIEAETQIGAKRRDIWGNFTIELLLIILIPLIISLGITIPIVNNLYTIILNIPEQYLKFKAWIPWWLIITLGFSAIILLSTGWFSRMIPLVKGYRPIKQE